MKKFALAVVIFFLILSTAIIKNTTKQIEDEIFTAKENIRILKTEFENVSLEYDYLSSSERLLDYQSQYFEDKLIQKNINDIRIYNVSNDENKSISRYSPVIEQVDPLFRLIQKKPITPSDEEVNENPPSRSAKFRYAIKKRDFYNFDTDIEEQFRNYIEIENYGDKL